MVDHPWAVIRSRFWKKDKNTSENWDKVYYTISYNRLIIAAILLKCWPIGNSGKGNAAYEAAMDAII